MDGEYLIHSESKWYSDEIMNASQYPFNTSFVYQVSQEGNKDRYISKILILSTFPVILIFGTIGNLLTFIVMQRGSLKHSSTCFYMAILALADTSKYNISCHNIFRTIDKYALNNKESCGQYNSNNGCPIFYNILLWIKCWRNAVKLPPKLKEGKTPCKIIRVCLNKICQYVNLVSIVWHVLLWICDTSNWIFFWFKSRNENKCSMTEITVKIYELQIAFPCLRLICICVICSVLSTSEA